MKLYIWVLQYGGGEEYDYLYWRGPCPSLRRGCIEVQLHVSRYQLSLYILNSIIVLLSSFSKLQLCWRE